MQLTRFSDLGLRTLMYLQQAEPDRSQAVTIAEIASQFDVPHNHLVKVVNRLGKLGWLSATRGRKGGLALGVPAANLRLGQVLQGLEGSLELINCEDPPCTLRGQCLLKGALNAGLAAFYAKMDEYSLADVCATRTGEAIITLHRQFLGQQAARC
ncbi:Rrf2 family transcriptional regulator [Chitinimonas taiwanensis]|jgi:Rrf2 family nitric oxide-sensitive transcriptional repressor|uniref:Transcriptional regulator, BadM/Rrf2 family n=1 Tax=Chitinimonas taiwanensis DSM 18899 TaxID=1121279 RepID=A0A1K2HAC5_9NEIS|nr:Rrf2 family transcriptional regulator [Chitinimonas taiwanensis]SFZ73691.1 transcriptional regulator, BadM/Rrf2 family [Chitinimonas taiwanensis DSM 18899]